MENDLVMEMTGNLLNDMRDLIAAGAIEQVRRVAWESSGAFYFSYPQEYRFFGTYRDADGLLEYLYRNDVKLLSMALQSQNITEYRILPNTVFRMLFSEYEFFLFSAVEAETIEERCMYLEKADEMVQFLFGGEPCRL